MIQALSARKTQNVKKIIISGVILLAALCNIRYNGTWNEKELLNSARRRLATPLGKDRVGDKKMSLILVESIFPSFPRQRNMRGKKHQILEDGTRKLVNELDPSYDIYQTSDDGLKLTLDVPGFSKSQLSVLLSHHGEILTIQGTRTRDNSDSEETSVFQTSFQLDTHYLDLEDPTKTVQVHLQDGVLNIIIPLKKEMLEERDSDTLSLEIEEGFPSEIKVREEGSPSETKVQEEG